jgi:outer membrane protein insertion porin family
MIQQFFMRLSSILLLLVAATAPAWDQATYQTPLEVYEGQTVTAIDLIANPHRDVEPFRPLLIQKPGQLFSRASVQSSIDALRKQGNFPKVELNIVPDPSGLQLDFVLEPSYYLGVINFPEASKYFSYIHLLQVVKLSDEDPYDKERIPDAEQALTHFLQSNGYFQVAVHAESQIDDTHQLVNINFNVQMGKQARIGNVEIQGPEAPESARILQTVRSLRARFSGGLLKTGKAYTPERIKEATKLIKRTLAQQHRLASTVHENSPQYHADSNRVDLSFKVEVGPVVTVRMTGAKLSAIPFLSGREMKKLIPIYSEGAIDSDLVKEGQQNLLDYLQKKGYFDATVSTDYQRQPSQILLVYKVDRGKKHKVDRIEFHGNHQISESDLMAQITVKKSHIWTHGSVSQKIIKQSVNNLLALYRDRGYEDAKVTPQVTDHEPKIDVAFAIEEGQQTVIANVQVTGNQVIPLKLLTAPHPLEARSGGPYSARRLAEDRNRMTATYLNRGFLNVEVKATVVRHADDPHQVDVSYAITERQVVHVSEVIYLGQKATRLSLLKKTANVASESPMRRGELLTAESRLYDLNVFDWSSVGPRKPITDQTEEEALVKVHESKRNEITYGFSHRGGNVPTGTVAVPGLPTIGLGNNQIAPSQSTFASPRGSIEFTRRNMRGLAETASASILLSRLDQRALTTYGQPHFFGSAWTSLSSFSIERTSENPLFSASLGDLSFQLERVLNRKTNRRLQVRYDFNKTILSHLLVPELVLTQDRNVRLSTFSGTFLQDTRDKPLDAHRGMFATVNLGITPVALGSSADFGKLFGQYAFYKSLHSVVFANSVRLGFIKAFSGSFVPTSQLFFSGGGTSLRGFPIDEAGPQRLVPFCVGLQNQTGCVNVTVPLGGRQLVILNSEARFPLGIVKPLGGVIFYDGGNVNTAINFNNFLNNYTNTVGLGLRYSTPIGPVRIDIGRNLNPVPGINPTQYFITLGQSF